MAKLQISTIVKYDLSDDSLQSDAIRKGSADELKAIPHANRQVNTFFLAQITSCKRRV